jgi:hypothetical protein
MSGTTPRLSYIGSVDTTTSSTGTVMFSVQFASPIAVLMFEYKYQLDNVLATPAHIYTGFIYPESAQPVQGSNYDYYLPIPVIELAGDYNIAVRVYDANNLGVTNWSEPLAVYPPPQKPTITSSAYDRGVYPGTTTLWLNLDSTTLDANNKYIVSYYYVPALGGINDTHWVVTELLSLTGSSTVLEVEMDGIVSDDPNYDEVYVAINAVLEFQDIDENYYYSVSAISDTSTANQAAITAPELEPVEYKVYADKTTQEMTLNWIAPTSSFIPDFGVAEYTLYIIVNNGYPPEEGISIPGTVTTYDLDVGGYEINDKLTFYLTATLTSGTVTEPSNDEVEFIFYYADAPQELYYNWAVYDDDTSDNLVDISFTFTNSVFTGSGEPQQYVWQINKSGDSTPVKTEPVDYSATAVNYNVLTNFPYIVGDIYTISVFLQTDNTNPTPDSPLNGFSITSSSIVPSSVPFIFDVVTGVSGLAFKVSSNVVLNPSAAIFFIQQSGPSVGELGALPYSTVNAPYTEVDGNYIYSFSSITQPSFSFATGNYTISASNQAGIGYKVINYVAP